MTQRKSRRETARRPRRRGRSNRHVGRARPGARMGRAARPEWDSPPYTWSILHSIERTDRVSDPGQYAPPITHSVLPFATTRQIGPGSGPWRWLRPADRPRAGAALRIEQRRPVRLLGRRGRARVAGASDGGPGAVVELVETVVGPVGGDRGGVATGLTGGDRLERGARDANRLRRREAALRGGRGAGARAAVLRGLRGLRLAHCLLVLDPLVRLAHQLVEVLGRPHQHCHPLVRMVAVGPLVPGSLGGG